MGRRAPRSRGFSRAVPPVRHRPKGLMAAVSVGRGVLLPEHVLEGRGGCGVTVAGVFYPLILGKSCGGRV